MNETPDCQRVRPLLEELATGAATGYERAGVLRHVVACPTCRHELSDLARVADELLLLAPRREPPAGFEATVVKRIMRLHDGAHRGRRLGRHLVRVTRGLRRRVTERRHRLSRPAVRVAAAVMTLIVAVSGGAALAYWHGAPERQLADRYQQAIGLAGGHYPRAVPVTTASGSAVGHVFLYQGTPPWATVALTAVPESGDYTMSVVATNGRRYPEGVCTVTGGSGISSYPLPVPLAQIAAIDLVRPGTHLTVHP